jgi:hypothetical protein
MGGLHNLRTGTCCAWSLPTDATCARAARQLYGAAAAEVGIRDELICDGVMMASELAANTLHAGAGTAVRGGGALALVTARPELWLYLRGSGMMRELVCKVFDAFPAWKLGRAPGPLPPQASAGAVSGRGLQVVHELSRGRWGHHLTRARLGGRKPRGKAVWFAVPVPARDGGSGPGAGDGRVADLAAIRASRLLSARQAIQVLEGMLSRAGAGQRAAAGRSARRGHVGALGAAWPDRVLPRGVRFAAHARGRQAALDVHGPRRRHRARRLGARGDRAGGRLRPSASR